jgi:hypothetical protein
MVDLIKKLERINGNYFKYYSKNQRQIVKQVFVKANIVLMYFQSSLTLNKQIR